jgi:hypothetical protein
MSIKATVNSGREVQERKFPKLMWHPLTKDVFLVSGRDTGSCYTGMCLTNYSNQIGEYRDGFWTSGLEDFYGTVTLQNQ